MRMASRFIALYPGILLHCCLILPQAQSSDLATAGSSAVSAGLEQQNLTSSADQGRIRAIQLNHLKAADAAEQLNKLLNQPDLEPLDGKNRSRINIWPGFTDKVLRVEADADDLATVMALLKFVDTPSDIPQKPAENAARRVASGQEGAAPDAMNDRLHSIRLQHIEAADAAEQLNKLLNPSALQGNPGGKRTQRIRIRPGSAANLLSVEADPEDLVTVMELVKFLDTPPERAADSPRAGSSAKGSRAGKIAKLADNAAGSVGFYEQQSQEKPQLPEQLTLQDAIGLALKNSVQLELAVMDLLAAREETQGAEGYMEPDLVMDASIEESRRKNTVEQSIRLLSDTFEEDNTRYSMAVEGILPLGTSYRVGYDMDDLANSLTNRSYALPFRSEYTGFAGVSVTQPLLKNFGSTYTRSNLINARLEEEIARQNLRKQWMRTVANTVLAYWDVWMHQKLAGVRFNSLKNARVFWYCCCYICRKSN